MFYPKNQKEKVADFCWESGGNHASHSVSVCFDWQGDNHAETPVLSNLEEMVSCNHRKDFRISKHCFSLNLHGKTLSPFPASPWTGSCFNCFESNNILARVIYPTLFQLRQFLNAPLFGIGWLKKSVVEASMTKRQPVVRRQNETTRPSRKKNRDEMNDSI